MHWLLPVYTSMRLMLTQFFVLLEMYECYYSQSIANTCWAPRDSQEDKWALLGKEWPGGRQLLFLPRKNSVAILDCGSGHMHLGLETQRRQGPQVFVSIP